MTQDARRSAGGGGATVADRHGLPVPDLPVDDPGVPRFVYVIAAVALAGAAWLLVRPTAVTPLGDMQDEIVAEESTEAEDTSGGMIFVREGCGACHVTAGPSSALGPSLSGVATAADQRVRSPSYTGRADNAGDYLREATLDHCVDLVPGYDCVEVSDVALRLSIDEIDRLVTFMMGLSASEDPR